MCERCDAIDLKIKTVRPNVIRLKHRCSTYQIQNMVTVKISLMAHSAYMTFGRKAFNH